MPLRRAGTAIALTVVAAVVLLALHLLASTLTARHLAHDATLTTARIRHGEPLWQWRFVKPRDVIAGRAFGHAELTQGKESLDLRSSDGTPFEIGLPIATGLDLAHWPWLTLSLRSMAPVELSVVWQADTGPSCTASFGPLPRTDTVRVDLRRPRATGPHPATCPLPSSARLLRLRLQTRAGAHIALVSAALEPAQMMDPDHGHPDSAYQLAPDHPDGTLAALADATGSPWVYLPAGVSAETMLDMRDRVSAIRPAARVVVGHSPLSAPDAGLPAWSGWLATGAYLLVLSVLTWRRVGGWLALAATILGPLCLIAGLQWGLHASRAGLVACAGALLFAAFVQWHDRPRAWHWIGDWRRPTWWLPLALIPVALLIGLMAGHGFAPISPRRALTYLAWALLQQWLVQAFFADRLQRLLPAPWAVLLAAMAFALLHTPNGLLMQLCFVAELWLGGCFLRSRSLLPLAIAHAGSALLIGAGLAGGALRSLEVSARFFL